MFRCYYNKDIVKGFNGCASYSIHSLQAKACICIVQDASNRLTINRLLTNYSSSHPRYRQNNSAMKRSESSWSQLCRRHDVVVKNNAIVNLTFIKLCEYDVLLITSSNSIPELSLLYMMRNVDVLCIKRALTSHLMVCHLNSSLHTLTFCCKR